MVYILLADGFEEAEALVPADLLRRAGVEVTLVGVTGETVTGAHGIAVVSEVNVETVNVEHMEMLVVPGGLPGVTNVAASESAMELVKAAAEGKSYLAAICAAPAMVLGPLGVLKGYKATGYPGTEEGMEGAQPQKGYSVVVDGDIISGEGPGSAFDFVLTLVQVLKGEETAKQVASDACWRY